jgi:hypothetical protein
MKDGVCVSNPHKLQKLKDIIQREIPHITRQFGCVLRNIFKGASSA